MAGSASSPLSGSSISYHFQHHAGQHDMVLTDMAASHTTIGPRPFHPDDGHHQEEIE
ncbi:MAG: hypothetical protein JNN06_12255, partial [Gemmobacter sp.]|nr:hypothetical protein [Gemmobacter sp.]